MNFVFAVSGWYLGGFVTFCRNLSMGLRSRGHRVTLLILPDANVDCRVPEGIFDQRLVVLRGFSRVSSYAEKVARAIDLLKPEVLVLNDCPYAMAALPFIGRESFRVPVIHNVEPAEIELALTNQQWWDRVIAVSPCVAEAVVARGVSKRLSTCAYGVPLPREGQRARQPKKAIRLISVSRIVQRQKRMDRLPGVARLLAERRVDFHWSVLGSGDYLPQLRQSLDQCGLLKHFTFKGSVSPSGVAEALAEADVFVMHSDYEGLPQALLEAMAYGVVPVVSRLEGSTTCAVVQGVSGFLCRPSESEEFADAIVKLAHDSALRCTLGAAAAATVAREFSLDAFTERFMSIVGELRCQGVQRPSSLVFSPALLRHNPFGCLGFWRSLRHQTLGHVKRQALRRLAGLTTAEGGQEPRSG